MIKSRNNSLRVLVGLVLISTSPLLGLAQTSTTKSDNDIAKSTSPLIEEDKVVDIVTIDPLIILNGNINGDAANVLFDTGCWPNIINQTMAHKVSVTAGSIEKKNEGFKFCDWDSLVVGGLRSLNKREVCLLDLNEASKATGTRIDAVVGSPFSYGRVFEIDFENKLFTSRNSMGTCSVVEKLEFDKHGRPWIELKIGECNAKFLIDTGFDRFLDLDQSTADKLLKSGFAEKKGDTIVLIYSDGLKTAKESTILIKNQELFGVEFTELEAGISETPKIGLGLLQNFRVTFDFKEGKLGLNRTMTPSETAALHKVRSKLTKSKKGTQLEWHCR